MEAWANSLEGFEYPAEPYRSISPYKYDDRGTRNRYDRMKRVERFNNCEGSLANDLGWEQWQVAQCIKRFGKQHDETSRKCCEMFNTYNDSSEYYMNNYTKEINRKCNWNDQFQERDQQDCSWSHVNNPTIQSFEVGMRSDKDEYWSSFSKTSDDWGKLMCGAKVKVRDSEEDDETGTVDFAFTWCNKDDWSNQVQDRFSKYDNFGNLRKKLSRDYDDCYRDSCFWDVQLMCNPDSYVYKIQASTERGRGGWYDDSALGDFRIYCRKLNSYGYNTDSTNMRFDGSYGHKTPEAKDHFVFKAEVFAERYQGSGSDDDAAVTDVKIWTSQ